MEHLQTAADPSPFHPGERAVQAAAGVRDEAEQRGRRMLNADLNPQQVAFFGALPFLITGHVDSDGQPWAGLLAGEPGFVDIDAHGRHCTIAWERGANPAQPDARPGDAIGLLGIDLASRRRNRLNGAVLRTATGHLRVAIQQGFGNCPKYITGRAWPAAALTGSFRPTTQAGLSDAARALAQRSDTFFIATASGAAAADPATQYGAWGADVSHRGGEPGFLQAEGDTLRFADFPGNNLFNTLGNIARHPPCGILLPDFAGGDMLQLSARAAVLPTGTGREVVLDVLATRHWRRIGTAQA